MTAMHQPRITARLYTAGRRLLQPHNGPKRDLIMAHFHEEQRQIHPDSEIYQLEHIVRLVNSSEHWRPRPYLGWPVQDILVYPEDLAHEFLYCLIAKFSRNSDIFTRSEVHGIWGIIEDLSTGLNERDRTAGTTKVILISALIQQLDEWLKRSSIHITLNRAERVRICVQGLIDIFFPWPSMTINSSQLEGWLSLNRQLQPPTSGAEMDTGEKSMS
ncbi:hypothetical protein AN958_00667 [Leucoagaricus sp. SymC.cos]|nr:hypothetical protein AN958_00667 [Leucoagaricus sp. SymC.cos]